MAGRSEDESTDRVVLDGSPAAWVADRAAAIDTDPEEYLAQVIASIRSIESEEGASMQAEGADSDAVAERLDALEDRLDEQIQDVRDRVIQVKREADQKASADHEHEDLEDAVSDLQAAVDAVGSEVTTLADRLDGAKNRIDRQSDRLERGFENYEEILQYLVDTTDELDEQVDAVGSALLAIRRRERNRRQTERRRAKAASLKETAQRHGTTEATCAACESEVTIGLLTEPACPFCGASIADVTPKRGFFGTATLETGSPPALEGGDSDGAGATVGAGGDGEDAAINPGEGSSEDAAVEAIAERESAAGDRSAPDILDEDGSLVDLESGGSEPSDPDREASADG